MKNKLEYVQTELEEKESRYIYIPLSIIIDKDIDTKRIGVFAYLKTHCGINDIIGFTAPDMVEWCGGKIDRRIGGANERFLNVVDDFKNKGYITYLTEKTRSGYIKCEFNSSLYKKDCINGYSVVYLDEMRKIIDFNSSKNKNIISTTLLLVFAYLRNKIPRRPNELKPEERTVEGIKERRGRLPDAYNANIKDIAEDIGISPRTVVKAIDILENELGLIVTDKAYRIKNKNGEFRTPPTIFANAYKRDDKYLLASGDEYSRVEIELKAENIKQYYKNYKIDKNKRKN